MLAYIKYPYDYDSTVKECIKQELSAFVIKKRTNPSWPGTGCTIGGNREFEIIFYKCCQEVKPILLKAKALYDWAPPSMPEDLAFFRGNLSWIHSTSHEEMASMTDPTQEDIDYFDELGLISKDNLDKYKSNPYFEKLDPGKVDYSAILSKIY